MSVGEKAFHDSGCNVQEQNFFLSLWVFLLLDCFVVFAVISSMPFSLFFKYLATNTIKFLKGREIKIYR